MKVKISLKRSHLYVYMILSLVVSFWVLSLFEFIMTSTNNKWSSIGITILFRFLNDFWAAILIGFGLFPFYLGFAKISEKWSVIIFKGMFVAIVLIQFVLVKYSLTTFVNLGADILGSSYNDTTSTVFSIGSTSIVSLIPLILFPLVFLIVNFIINKHGIEERKLSLVFSILIVLFGFLKLVAFEASEIKYKNKIHYLVSDIIKFQINKSEVNLSNLESRNDFPLLKPFVETEDVLAPFFNIKKEKPNIIFIIVQGLGGEFLNGNEFSGFTPYLDSLSSKSLFWENFVSNNGRAFGALPSIFGSLPYGDNGFLDIRPTPSHISLISILKANEYTVSYYEGSQSSFDRKINFLEYNKVDHLVDQNNYGEEYEEISRNSEGFSWGYSDSEIFKKTLADSKNRKMPKLDIIMTQAIHSPFRFPGMDDYLLKVDSLLDSNQSFGISKDDIREHKEVYASILYSDYSIKSFIKEYSKREEFSNTIFIITGNHRVGQIPQKDKLCRYHVPLIIYSPMLKKPESFKSISSHWDITPTLVTLLVNNYKVNKLDKISWMSQGLDTTRAFRNIHQVPLMRNKGLINDFIYKDYLLSDGDLYKINEGFGTHKVKVKELIEIISDSMQTFKRLNAYVTQQNKIFPDSLNVYANPNVVFSDNELIEINSLVVGLSFEEIFDLAKDFAHEKNGELVSKDNFRIAELLCDYILNEFPNHVDARILRGRILGWNKDFKNAEVELLNVLNRFPFYSDGYLALLDLYWTSNQEEKSFSVFETAIENKVKDPQIGFKMVKAFKRINKLEKATFIIDSVLKIYPKNNDYITLKQSLK